MEDIEEQYVEIEDTRAEDNYMTEGNLFYGLKEVIRSFEGNGVLDQASIKSVLEKLIEDNCAHYWVSHQDSGTCYCRKCRIPQNVDCKTMHINNHNHAEEE